MLIRPYFRLLQNVIQNHMPQRGFGAIRHKLKKGPCVMQRYQMFAFHLPLKLCQFYGRSFAFSPYLG